MKDACQDGDMCRHALRVTEAAATQVMEHVAAALGKNPREVKQINFLSPPEQAQLSLMFLQ